MKNLYLLAIATLLILCGTSSLYTQDRSVSSSDFHAGVSGGMTYTKLFAGEFSTWTMRTYHFQVDVAIGL